MTVSTGGPIVSLLLRNDLNLFYPIDQKNQAVFHFILHRGMAVIESALKLARLGIAVFPLSPCTKIPMKGTRGVHDATTDGSKIREWWGREPEANIGVALGRVSNIVAVDLDKNHGATEADLRKFPRTVTIKTRHGYHIYFRYSSTGIKNHVVLSGNDGQSAAYLRSDGYYTVGPGSIVSIDKGKFLTPHEYSYHADSGGDLSFDDCALAEWPQEKLSDQPVADAVLQGVASGGAEANRVDSAWPSPGTTQVNRKTGKIAVGLRHAALTDQAVAMRKRGHTPDQIRAELHLRNQDFETPKTSAEGIDTEIDAMVAWVMGNVVVAEVIAPIAVERIPREEAGVPASIHKKLTGEEWRELTRQIISPTFHRLVTDTETLVFRVLNPETKELVHCTNVDDKMAIEVSKLTTNFLGTVPSPTDVSALMSWWRTAGDVVEKEPLPFAWADQDEWSFRKLAFVPTVGQHPAWDEFLERLSNADEFMAFIWSIFEIRNKSRQFLYLVDPDGQGGKSTVINVLSDVFGSAATAITGEATTGEGKRFLLAQLFSKRLVTYADCKNPKFCMSEVLRNMTSGDNVWVEPKGKAGFNRKIYAKLIIGSNHEPIITGAGADKSRLLRIDLSKPNTRKNDPLWAGRLRDELPTFLYACRAAYEELCPNHGEIVLSEGTVERISDSTGGTEFRWEGVVAKHFRIEPMAELHPADWASVKSAEKLTDQETHNLKEYLKRQYGVKMVRTSTGTRPRVLKGIGLMHREFANPRF